MNRLYRIFAILPTLIALLVMCRSATAQQGEIRVVALSHDAPSLDFFIGDTTNAAVAGLPYGGASASLTRPTGMQRLIATRSGMTAPRYIDASVKIDTMRRINVLAVNSVSVIEPFTIAFNLARVPVPDSAYIRLVHASADLGGVDVRMLDASGAARTFSNFSFKSNTQFFAIPPGVTEVWLMTPGSGTIIRKFKGTIPGNIYASILVSGATGSLKAHVLTETSTTQQVPMTELGAFVDPPASTLRVVHALPDGPAIDIYLNDTIAAQSLFYGGASPLVALDSGTFSVGVTVAGQPLGNAVLNTALDLNPDTAYMVVATGSLAAAKLNALTLTRSLDLAATDSTIMLRVLHAGFGPGPLNLEMTDGNGDTIQINALAYEASTSYRSLQAGRIRVRATKQGTTRPVFAGEGTIEEGSVATLVLTVDSGRTRLHAVIENVVGAQQPMYEFTPAPTSWGRLVHLSPDAPAIEAFFYNDTNDSRRVAYREASYLSRLDSGNVNVKIAPAGSGIGAAILSADFAVTPTAFTTLFAVGSIADQTLDTLTLETKLADAPPQGELAIRILNACPDCGPLDVGMTVGARPTQGYNALAFKASTDFMIAPAGLINVKLYENGVADSILDVSGTIASDPALVTAIITGRKSDGSLGVNLLFDTALHDQRPMVLLSNITTSVDGEKPAEGVAIAPNPARGSTTISYTLRHAAAPRIALYNSIGRLSAMIEPGAQPAGRYNAAFSTASLPAGSYSVIITAGSKVTYGGTLMVQR